MAPVEVNMILEPQTCPHCDTPVVKAQDPKSKIITFWCPNRSCKGRLKEDLAVVGSRDVLEIDLLGPEMAQKLVDEGYVVELPDLFLFAQELAEKHQSDPDKYKAFLTRQGFSVANVTKLYGSVLLAMDSRDWDRWIVALNIEGIGKVLGKQLAMALGLQGLDTLCGKLLTVKGLGLEGFGEVKLQALQEWAMLDSNRELCQSLHDVGVRPKIQKVKVAQETTGEGPCQGMIVCVTGEHLAMEREEIQNHLAGLGAVIKSGVSKKLTHLIAGAGAGPSKVQKARELGIVILNTDWLKTTLETNGIPVSSGGLDMEMDGDVEI